MKKILLKMALHFCLTYVLGSREKGKLVTALAEASREAGDTPFVRRGRVYRDVKELAGKETPLYLVNLGTEAAQVLDELEAGK